MNDKSSELSAYDLRSDGWLRENMPERERMIRQLDWVRDGIGTTELRAVQGLIYLAKDGGSYFEALIEQRWVVEGKHKPTMESLGKLASRYPGAFERIMTHPTITDGISDRETKILAVLYGMQQIGPDLTDVLLDMDQVMMEERTIKTPLTEDLPIVIIRTEPGSDRTMDIIEHAARSHAEFMGMPWPSENVIQLFAGDLDRVNGAHFGPNVRSKAKIDAALS